MKLIDRKRFSGIKNDPQFFEFCDWIEEQQCGITDNFLQYIVKLWGCFLSVDDKKICVITYIKKTPNEKSVRTLENYIDMYGSCGTVLWESYKISMSNSLKLSYKENRKSAKYDHFCADYYIKKGYTQEEADNTVNTRKNKAIQRSVEKVRSMTNRTTTQICYWTDRGYSLEEAKAIISARQVTFSLDICIKKYGDVDGIRIWRDRQITWQKTLNQKTHAELLRINKAKTKNNGSVSKQEKELVSLIHLDNITTQIPIGKYVYDICVGNKIIEYNGDFWHCNPLLFDSEFIIFGKSAKDIWQRDIDKARVANNNGYVLLVIWESDFLSNKTGTALKCKEFLCGLD